MTIYDILKQLEEMGTAQNRKISARHGVTGEMYGVSYGNLNKLVRTIKKNQELAEALWESENHDARVLATMIADPQKISAVMLDDWSRDLDNYILTDAFSKMVAQTPHVRAKMEAWTSVEDEWIGQAGWNLAAQLAMSKKKAGADLNWPDYLQQIEAHIDTSANRIKHAMNGALIAIGLRNDDLQAAAIAAARRIGPVEVDHGETNCQTPDAEAYIKKAAARRKK